MSQSAELIDALKRLLKSHGKTYADVAQCLGLSEASVKRRFSKGTFTLHTLESICDWLQIDMLELVLGATQNQQDLSQLSEAQETELVSQPQLALVAVCVMNHWSLKRIVATYTITEAECVTHLLTLDRLGMIRLLPENRVRLRIARDFAWRPGGPIHRFFQGRVQSDFLDANFQQTGELLRFQQAMLSTADNQRIQQKIQRLMQELAELHAEGVAAPGDARYGTALLIALRPWEPDVFAAMRR